MKSWVVTKLGFVPEASLHEALCSRLSDLLAAEFLAVFWMGIAVGVAFTTHLMFSTGFQPSKFWILATSQVLALFFLWRHWDD